MILFFDTETTGFVHRDRNPDDPSQPNLVELAMILTDNGNREWARFCAVIFPEEWEIPAAAQAAHGIDTATATRYGIAKESALHAFTRFVKTAHIIVGHNLDLDIDVMETALCRWQGRPVSVPREPARFCTMKEAAPILKLPKPSGRKSPNPADAFKWPKLSECMEYFFQEKYDGHRAMADTEACRRVYWKLREKN